MKNKIPERRADGAKWERKEVGLTDFTTEDLKLRAPGSFEKGAKPANDSSDENFKNLLEG